MTAAPLGWNDNRLGWLGLCWFEGFGSRTLNKLREYFGDHGERAFAIARNDLIKLGIRECAAQDFCAWRAQLDLAMLAHRCDADGIRLVMLDDDEYPPNLRAINDPPAALFVRGTLAYTDELLAVVGTRSISRYGLAATRSLLAEAASQGIAIVSGLAMGIDAAAHEVALETHGRTIAVLPGGCNNAAIYPRINSPLAQRILAQGGALISEFPPGTESFRHHFPLRNRIIAGMCHATVVVEAAEMSGSLITAKLALEYNREVLAVPGPITSRESQGTNQLIKCGAVPCTSADDIYRALKLPAATTTSRIAPNLTDEERAVIRLLKRPLHSDDLIRALERPAPVTIAALTSMEVRGLIEQQSGLYSTCVSLAPENG